MLLFELLCPDAQLQGLLSSDQKLTVSISDIELCKEILPLPRLTENIPECEGTVPCDTQHQDRPAISSTDTADAVQVKLEFADAMKVLLERETAVHYRLSRIYVQSLMGFAATEAVSCGRTLSSARRKCVYWIFQLGGILKLSTLTAAHAVAFLDRFLSLKRSMILEEMQLAATVCLWIAGKMEDSCAPNLSCLRASLPALPMFDEESIRGMEAVVLRALGWRMLAVTAADFLGNMLAHLSVSGLPPHLSKFAGLRADELLEGLLPEVEFLGYEPSVVSICVMQCLLDETVPIQAASLMASMRRALAVDTVAAQQCYRTLVDMVVDPLLASSIPSPDRVLDRLDH